MTRTAAIILLLLCQACTTKDRVSQRQKDNHPQFRVQTFKVKTGWGYAVFINDKEYIRQRFVPAVAGEIPFTTAKQALDVGNYVVYKLRRDGNPSLTQKELRELHIVATSIKPQH